MQFIHIRSQKKQRKLGNNKASSKETLLWWNLNKTSC